MLKSSLSAEELLGQIVAPHGQRGEGKNKAAATFERLHFATLSLTCYVTSLQASVSKPQGLAQAVPEIDYEELLEEMEKLDIADLMLIHRKVTLR